MAMGKALRPLLEHLDRHGLELENETPDCGMAVVELVYYVQQQLNALATESASIFTVKSLSFPRHSLKVYAHLALGPQPGGLKKGFEAFAQCCNSSATRRNPKIDPVIASRPDFTSLILQCISSPLPWGLINVSFDT